MNAKKKSVRLEKAIPALCLILCLLQILSPSAELPAHARSNIVTVNLSQSIQAAIDSANPGDTIFVPSGTYHESLEVNKSISLIGEDRDLTVIDGQNDHFIINISSNNVNIESFTITTTNSSLNPDSGININSKGNVISHNIISNSQQGIALISSSNNVISDNTITKNTQGIVLQTSSSNNVISDNTITTNTQGGIALYASYSNLLSGNMISNNYGGFSIYFSGGNVFTGNTFAGNYPGGDTISFSNYNAFYDNDFYDTTQVDSFSRNTWDNGVNEGNYWSNYAGHDRGDGIGTENHPVSAPYNIDHYPLMGAFSSFKATLARETYQISIISNSTISDFNFQVGTETGNKIIQFNVTGAEGTVGFSRIAIPTALMNTSVIVLVGEKETAPTWLHGQNAALNYLYLTYLHSNQTILLISSKTMDLYTQLLDKFLTLNETYNQLLSSYTTQLDILSNYAAQLGLLSNYTTQLRIELNSLNNTYDGLLSSYTSLLGNYSQLQQGYSDLNASYQQHLSDYSQNLQNVRSLTYIFAAVSAILIVITVYFSKHAHPRPTKPPGEKDRF